MYLATIYGAGPLTKSRLFYSVGMALKRYLECRLLYPGGLDGVQIVNSTLFVVRFTPINVSLLLCSCDPFQEHNPGEVEHYNDIIRHETLRVAVCDALENNKCPPDLL